MITLFKEHHCIYTVNFLVRWYALSFYLMIMERSSVDFRFDYCGGVRDLHLSCNTLYLLSPRLCFFIVIDLDLFVNREYSLTS